jgi:soluble lytic murein transglycosylase-like protein
MRASGEIGMRSRREICTKSSREQFVRSMQLRVIIICVLGFVIGCFISDAKAEYAGTVLASKQNVEQSGTVYMQILRNTQGQPPHDPIRLADAFMASAAKHGLDPVLLSAIGAVESNYYVGAVNSRSNDFGLMQINATNIKKLGLSKKRLLTDIEYSIEAGASILAWFKSRYAKKEPRNWFCRYNWGTRNLKGVGGKICKKYAAKVRRRL